MARMALEGRAPISTIFYHRVADHGTNDWTISQCGFEQHIDYFRKNFDVISLSELQRRCETKSSHRAAISITFDDGYGENCDYAIPLMLRHKIPCTYFVSLNHVQTGRPFAHDLKVGRPLRINSIAEIRQMSDAGIDIGLHSRTHIDFDRVTCRKTLKREITDAKAELEDMIGRPIRYFAFPYGLPSQLTPQAIEVVYESGMLGFCSAYGAYNLVGQDSFHIRRIHGDTDFVCLENWLTFDKRKLRNQPVIPYELPEHRAVQSTQPPAGLLGATCFGSDGFCESSPTGIGSSGAI
jgi:peptidoglycan/xylan/chitin deacetylase (PgdA/CDA1 family)